MYRLLSLAALIAAWEIAGQLADSRLLPPLSTVVQVIAAESAAGRMLSETAITLARVLASFTLAMVIGAALGLLLGRSPRLDGLLDSWVLLLLNLPALVVIVLAYVWFGQIEAAAIGAVAINKIPTVVVMVREGARALDAELEDMAASFRLSRWRTLRHVILPQLYPYLMGAARSGLALVWKIVLVVELLGRPNGVGFQISIAFQHFDVAMILAYALTFIIVVQVVEFGLLRPLDRRLHRWRQ
ncbi:MAG: ABC transporter permease subunit [Alphaproteobacteria bacterium]